jgi:hypothetical protein
LICAWEFILPGKLTLIENDFTRKRKAVSLQTTRMKAYNDISCTDGFARDERLLLNATYDRTDEIVLADRIKTRHFSRLATEKSHVVFLASFAKTGNYTFEDDGINFSRADIIHEEQRLGTLNEDIVNAVVYDILSDGVVLVHYGGNFELSAHAVCRRDKDLILACRSFKKTPERADVTQHVRGLGSGNHLLDGTYRAHFDVNIDAGLRIRRLSRCLAHFITSFL